jgi:hypothetical protein
MDWQAIEILQRSEGWGQVELARNYANLAQLYSKQGRYADAEPVARRALDMRPSS